MEKGQLGNELGNEQEESRAFKDFSTEGLILI